MEPKAREKELLEVPSDGVLVRLADPLDLVNAMKSAAHIAGVGSIFMTEAWLEGIRQLRRDGVPGQEIVQALGVALQNAPDEVGFFPQDFPRWRRIALNARQVAEARQRQKELFRRAQEKQQVDPDERFVTPREGIRQLAKLREQLRVQA